MGAGGPPSAERGGAADARVGARRRGARATPPNHRLRRSLPSPGGPSGARLPRPRPEPTLGRRPYLRAHLVGLRLRSLHHRRLLPLHRRLARLAVAAHRPRTLRAATAAPGKRPRNDSVSGMSPWGRFIAILKNRGS